MYNNESKILYREVKSYEEAYRYNSEYQEFKPRTIKVESRFLKEDNKNEKKFSIVPIIFEGIEALIEIIIDIVT